MDFKDYPPNYHFGHLAFERLSQYPDRVCQIDAATGEEETYESVLNRSIKLAKALRAFGLNPGDVMAIGGLNHLDICIPHFAALFNGLPIVGVDPFYKYDELRALFNLTRPKIAFFQNESYETYARAAADLQLDVKLVTFDQGECTMKKFMEIYEKSESEEDFKVTEYDLDKIYPFLISTSGTTGSLKVAAFKNKPMLTKDWFINMQRCQVTLDLKIPTLKANIPGIYPIVAIGLILLPILLAKESIKIRVTEYDLDTIYPFLICTSGTTGSLKVAAFKNKPMLTKEWWSMKYHYREPSIKTTLVLSPVNWISFFFSPISVAGTGGIRLQTSKPDNVDQIVEMINKYRPEIALFSPAHLGCLLPRHDEVDLTCFKLITVTGSKVSRDIFAEFKKLLASNCMLLEKYGQTETIGAVLAPNPFGPRGCCGRPLDLYNVKLVDPDTDVEIKEPNVTGEMLVKGPSFSGYYNTPESPSNWSTEDGFYKTGDLMYRDKDDNYFFVDRIKTLMKYRNWHIYPAELEEVISSHPGVMGACVVGVDDPVDGQRPVACVVRHSGCDVTAQEIKDLIEKNLSKHKTLRGGVLFLDSLPYTSSGKIHRNKLREIANAMNAKRK